MTLDKETLTTLVIAVALGTGGGSGLSVLLDDDMETINREETQQWEAINEKVDAKDLEIFFLKKGCPQ